jgi:hypothetical protein
MLAATCGALLFTLLMTPMARAGCGGVSAPAVTHTSWQPMLGQARLLRAALIPSADGDDWGHDDHEADIVGFWHVKFVSKGSEGIPDGAEIDAGYSQWHSDGTEIMNSGGRSPLTGDFCLGVWKKVGERKYKLNHFAAAWDATGTSLIGPAQIKEEVTVDKDGKSFSGTFTIDQFDESGNSLAHVQGDITGKRITVETKSTSVF